MYLIFDTETTGLPKNYQAPLDDFSNWPRLVQLAWNMYDFEGNLWESYNFIIKPKDFIIPVEASNIHRITQERALAEGVDIKDALSQFVKDALSAEFLVGHNISFDESIVGSELLRAGLLNPLPAAKKICTMKQGVQAARVSNGRGGLKWPNLSELYQALFGHGFKDAHDALVDVEACADCLFELKRRDLL